MKVYVVNYIDAECGQIDAFKSKREAEQRHRELKEMKDNDEIDQVFDIDEQEFSISAPGILLAIEYGAKTVYK